MLNVVLINPSQSTRYPQPPLGLALIAAILEREKYPVRLIDANALNLGPAAAAGMVAGADVVGLTAMTPTIGPALNIARQIKQFNSKIKVIIGGPHVTLLPEETLLSSKDIDIVCRGESDLTVTELLTAIENRLPLDKIAGISFRRDGEIIHTPERAAMVEMDSLPFPAYHLLPVKLYQPHPPHGMASPFAAMLTSRGCPYRCAYCSKPVFGTKFRAYSPERVIEEIKHLQRTLGAREIAFYDDSFTLDKKRAHAIAEKIIENKLKIAWTCETRVNLVDKELLKHMRQSGCYAVAYGIESASPEIIKVLQKDITMEQVKTAVRDSHDAGLQVIGYFMLGSPGETPDDIRRTIEFAKELKVDFAQFSVTTPFPGTELYDIYRRENKGEIRWEDFVYAGTDNPATPVFESNKLTRGDLKAWTGRAYREYYLRPGYFWQRLRRCTSWGEIRLNFKGFLMLLRSI